MRPPVDALKENLAGYIDNELKTLVIDGGGGSKRTAGFQRAVQRAVIHAQGWGRDTVTGAGVLVGIFSERERAPPLTFSVSST
jgi:ATP-dependent Clp protease ATP-binding subunit ClpA